jgi:hypothetical protein
VKDTARPWPPMTLCEIRPNRETGSRCGITEAAQWSGGVGCA